MKVIKNWIIVDLSSTVLRGVVEGREIFTDAIRFISDDGYAVTDTAIYQLVEPDKVWYGTHDAYEKVNRFVNNKE